MMQIARHLPAWLLKRLPVRLARQCAQLGRAGIVPAFAEPSSTEYILQLLVDVSVIHQSDARTGIQRVVRSLLLQLLQAPPAGYRVCPIFATRQHGYCYAAPNFLEQPAQVPGASGRPVQAEVQVQSGDLFLGLDLAAHLLPRHQAQVLHWKRSGVKVHVLVYDLLPLQHPEWFNTKTTRNFKRWIKCVAIYADSAVCISNTVKVDLSVWLFRQFSLSGGTVPLTTIALGADIDASAPTKGLTEETEPVIAQLHAVPGVLMVGTLEPRKGYDQVLAAFELLKQMSSPEIILIIVGRPGWKTENLQYQIRSHPQLNKQIFWFDDASDELLQVLYAACRGVLVASHGEGFGLPLVEAALHDKPILARDLPVFRELCVPKISYFRGSTPEALTQALSEWLVQIASGVSSTQIGGTDAAIPQPHTWETAVSDLLRNIDLQ